VVGVAGNAWWLLLLANAWSLLWQSMPGGCCGGNAWWLLCWSMPWCAVGDLCLVVAVGALSWWLLLVRWCWSKACWLLVLGRGWWLLVLVEELVGAVVGNACWLLLLVNAGAVGESIEAC